MQEITLTMQSSSTPVPYQQSGWIAPVSDTVAPLMEDVCQVVFSNVMDEAAAEIDDQVTEVNDKLGELERIQKQNEELDRQRKEKEKKMEKIRKEKEILISEVNDMFASFAIQQKKTLEALMKLMKNNSEFKKKDKELRKQGYSNVYERFLKMVENDQNFRKVVFEYIKSHDSLRIELEKARERPQKVKNAFAAVGGAVAGTAAGLVAGPVAAAGTVVLAPVAAVGVGLCKLIGIDLFEEDDD